jgi:hypothetical protein
MCAGVSEVLAISVIGQLPQDGHRHIRRLEELSSQSTEQLYDTRCLVAPIKLNVVRILMHLRFYSHSPEKSNRLF